MSRTREWFNFAREFIRHPRHTGAVCPSSVYLARQMAALVPEGKGKVIELGPGSGPMTRALLQRGIEPDDLILVERTDSFAQLLRQRFPGLNIIHGDACGLSQLLSGIEAPIRAIVSSLPLRSMPSSVVRQISREINQISQPGTRYIQFTYHLHDNKLPFIGPFSCSECHIVWRNFPPARVDAFDRKG
ncbi:class I SAM-dependent methyltransferase [Halothiobacillus sp.]|uniref:class I SAM-dependent methyltransferase n=1 Tax=Halothiobacillus sp. TaxID=1891311 RepID=UPI0026022048|nr:phosphatidylethanolamine N-methyltransferase [Halothiobacillus sp.]MDD4965589.1 phosphatidylethanolamine N-methyltransferase [Halothiobacillus sp.]MDY0146455.1 phosphatidylethanolamine N-methyltransferase [Halothiobacillus sp.]